MNISVSTCTHEEWLEAEIERLLIENKGLRRALETIVAQGGNLSDEALEVYGINDGHSLKIMYLNSRDIARVALSGVKNG